jgi:hypothetical protein
VSVLPPKGARDRRLQAFTDHRCHDWMAIAGRFPGRPLRRRRGMMLVCGRATAARDRTARRQKSEDRIQNAEPQTPNPKPQTPNSELRTSKPGLHRSSLPRPDGLCWPIPWRASAPSAPWNDVSLRPATAARDRTPPGHQRPIEGSVGTFRGACPLGAAPSASGNFLLLRGLARGLRRR